MKVVIHVKDPEMMYGDIQDCKDPNGNLPDELEDLISKYVKYGEYLRIEFDTDAKTATVLPYK